MAVLGYLPKLKMGLVLAFSIFCIILPEECSLFNTPLAMFQCHTFFSSQDIKQNALLHFYLGNW